MTQWPIFLHQGIVLEAISRKVYEEDWHLVAKAKADNPNVPSLLDLFQDLVGGRALLYGLYCRSGQPSVPYFDSGIYVLSYKKTSNVNLLNNTGGIHLHKKQVGVDVHHCKLKQRQVGVNVHHCKLKQQQVGLYVSTSMVGNFIVQWMKGITQVA